MKYFVYLFHILVIFLTFQSCAEHIHFEEHAEDCFTCAVEVDGKKQFISPEAVEINLSLIYDLTKQGNVDQAIISLTDPNKVLGRAPPSS